MNDKLARIFLHSQSNIQCTCEKMMQQDSSYIDFQVELQLSSQADTEYDRPTKVGKSKYLKTLVTEYPNSVQMLSLLLRWCEIVKFDSTCFILKHILSRSSYFCDSF